MPLVLTTPTKLLLPDEWIGSSIEKTLAKDLKYIDLKVDFALRKWRVQKKRGESSWYVQKYGLDALEKQIAQLEAERVKSALFKREGHLYTYSGLSHRISTTYGVAVTRAYEMPNMRLIPYRKEPFPSRWYQQEAEDTLIAMGHGAVELATGLGKSHIICQLVHRIGLPAVVVAPTLSIARQLMSDLVNMFGTGAVGQFFGSKKEAAKKFVVAVSKSLTGLDPGSVDYNLLAGKMVLIGDESHLLPAETLAKVVLKTFGNVPYRFFLSGTQVRSDGLGILLEGITGHVAMRMSVRQGVDQKFLALPKFVQFRLRSKIPDKGGFDSIKANRLHLHKNEDVYRHAGALVRWAVLNGRRPLVLIEEVSQFSHLLPHLTGISSIGFAHGGVDKKLKESIPQAYHRSDSTQLVADFDKGILSVLVGTQCIGTGTDIKTANVVIDLVGLASEVRIRQNVGRGTRRTATKSDFLYVDYDIWNIPQLSKHAEKRRAIFDDIYGPVEIRG